MLKKILFGLIALLLLFLAYAATRPNTVRVERTIVINASQSKIFPLIDSLPAWSAWSPYEKVDPAMTRTFSGPASGKGATYAWKGNSKVGAGRMEIIESAPTARVTIRLDFTEPLSGHDTVDFTLQPRGDSTEVAWVMHGPNPFISKVMGVLFDMDKMVGDPFAAGLRAMKELAEKP